MQYGTRKDLVSLCEGLLLQTNTGITLFHTDPTARFEHHDDQGEEEDEEQITPHEYGIVLMSGCAILARLVLSTQTTAAATGVTTTTPPSPPEALHLAAQLLHDQLMACREYPDLQEEICKLCLEWWQAEAPEKLALSVQTLPCLVASAIRCGTGAAVKRCHTMRTAMEVFDFEDQESIAEFKGLLLRAAFAPCFLRCADGRRFLAYLFTIQPSFVRELTAIVKNQIPAGRRSVLDAYGEILFRAWNTATGACLLEVQQTCIQDLMESAILASTPALAQALRRVLNGLHSQKYQTGVDAMLLELYEPILFRRINAANPNVRKNALELFFDAFPLRDPDETNEESDRRLTEQFAIMATALKDNVPAVRIAAIQGTVRILSAYWEIIPGPVTAGLIKAMVTELAFDATSPQVRAAVPETLSTLVECPLSHRLLNVVLPKLAPQLYDSSNRVRAAFLDLLLALRGLKDLSWSKIVDVPKLLEVLAADVSQVCARIQQLLLPKFFPDGKKGPPSVVNLLRSSPEAGRAFCMFLAGAHMSTSAGGVAMAVANSDGPPIPQHALIAMVKELTTHLMQVPVVDDEEMKQKMEEKEAKKKKKDSRRKKEKATASKKNSKTKNGNDNDDDAEDEEALLLETTESWEAILWGVSATAMGIAASSAAGTMDSDAYKGLLPGGTFMQLLKKCTTANAHEALFTMAAALPQTPGAFDIRTACVAMLSEPEGVHDTNDDGRIVRAALECVSAHPAARVALIKAIATSFGADPLEVWPDADEQAEQKAQRGKRRKFEKYNFEEISEEHSIRYLAGMLEFEATRTFFITCQVLHRLLPWVAAVVERQMADGDLLAVRHSIMVFMKANIHIMAVKDGECLPERENLQNQSKPIEMTQQQTLQGLRQSVEWTMKYVDEDSAGTVDHRVAVVLTCIAFSSEAARLSVVRRHGAGLEWTRNVCELVSKFLEKRYTGNNHVCGTGAAFPCLVGDDKGAVDDSEQKDGHGVVLSHIARLVRTMAASMRISMEQNNTDDEEASTAIMVVSLVESFMAALCCLGNAFVLSGGIKAHISGILAAMCHDDCAGPGTWLTPVAKMIGERDQRSYVGAGGDDDDSFAHDENFDENAAPIEETKKHKKQKQQKKTSSTLAQTSACPLVKHLIAASKLMKISECAAGQAATLALHAATAGNDVTVALGAVELCRSFGFQGVTMSGKSRAGNNNLEYTVSIDKLRELKNQIEDGTGGDHHVRLKATLVQLFPSIPVPV